MTTNRDRVKRTANRRRVLAPAYCPGQRVWLLARALPLPSVSQKLVPRYVGPYTIAQVINPSALRLTLPPPLSRSTLFSTFPKSSRWPPVVSLRLPLPLRPRPLAPSRRQSAPRSGVPLPGGLGRVWARGPDMGPPFLLC